jgi:hypothetical protein
MIRHILVWLFWSVTFAIANLGMILLGLPIVALALPFRVQHPETDKPFRQFPGVWRLVTLPAWAKPWDNIFDGCLGDQRGWWNDNCLKKYGKPATAFYPMWVWMAVRNSANYFSRVTSGCDMGRCVVTKLAGDDEVEQVAGKSQWNFLVATRDDGMEYHRLHCIFPFWFDPKHCIEINIGWKIDLGDNLVPKDAPIDDRIIGFVFRASPWKAL